MNEERRKFPRVNIQYPIRYQVDENDQRSGVMRDISESGISFHASHYYPPDTHLTFFINLEEFNMMIRVRGRVVRSWKDGENHYSALEILDISERERSILNQYIKKVIDEELQS